MVLLTGFWRQTEDAAHFLASYRHVYCRRGCEEHPARRPDGNLPGQDNDRD